MNQLPMTKLQKVILVKRMMLKQIQLKLIIKSNPLKLICVLLNSILAQPTTYIKLKKNPLLHQKIR